MSKKVMGIAATLLFFAALVPGLYSQTTMLYEEFEGGFPPVDATYGAWSTYDEPGGTAPVPLWRRNDQWGYSNGTDGTGYCAYARGYGQGRFYERMLLTPAIDATNWSNLRLEYEYYYQEYGSNPDVEEGRVEVQAYGEWTEMALYNRDLPSDNEDFPIGFADGAPDLQVRFIFDGNNDNYTWYFQIDNVHLSGTETGGGGDVDLEVVQIIRPYPEETGGEGFNPSCRVYNNVADEPEAYQAATVTAEVRCRIKDMATQQTVYEDVLSNYPLEFGYNQIDAFRVFTPEGSKNYEVLFVVEHPEDINVQNNDKTMLFSTAAGITVDATDIVTPADDQQGYFSPSASFMAGAEADAVGVTLHCKIEDAEYGAVVFEDEKGPVDITAGNSHTETFSEVTDLVDGSGYSISFWASIEGSDAGEMMSKTFNYTEAVAENPVVESFDLKVSGTTVNFNLGASTEVSLKVFDVAGNVVSTLAEGNYAAGSHTVNIDGLNSGVYFVKLTTPVFTDVAKVTVVK